LDLIRRILSTTLLLVCHQEKELPQLIHSTAPTSDGTPQSLSLRPDISRSVSIDSGGQLVHKSIPVNQPVLEGVLRL